MVAVMSIKKLRTETLKLSQRQLGEICGVSQPAVAHWEKGRKHPSRRSLSRLISFTASRGIQLSPEVLIGSSQT